MPRHAHKRRLMEHVGEAGSGAACMSHTLSVGQGPSPTPAQQPGGLSHLRPGPRAVLSLRGPGPGSWCTAGKALPLEWCKLRESCGGCECLFSLVTAQRESPPLRVEQSEALSFFQAPGSRIKLGVAFLLRSRSQQSLAWSFHSAGLGGPG